MGVYTRKREDKQTKSPVFFSHDLPCGLPPEGTDVRYNRGRDVFLLQII